MSGKMPIFPNGANIQYKSSFELASNFIKFHVYVQNLKKNTANSRIQKSYQHHLFNWALVMQSRALAAQLKYFFPQPTINSTLPDVSVIQ